MTVPVETVAGTVGRRFARRRLLLSIPECRRPRSTTPVSSLCVSADTDTVAMQPLEHGLEWRPRQPALSQTAIGWRRERATRRATSFFDLTPLLCLCLHASLTIQPFRHSDGASSMALAGRAVCTAPAGRVVDRSSSGLRVYLPRLQRSGHLRLVVVLQCGGVFERGTDDVLPRRRQHARQQPSTVHSANRLP